MWSSLTALDSQQGGTYISTSAKQSLCRTKQKTQKWLNCSISKSHDTLAKWSYAFDIRACVKVSSNSAGNPLYTAQTGYMRMQSISAKSLANARTKLYFSLWQKKRKKENWTIRTRCSVVVKVDGRQAETGITVCAPMAWMHSKPKAGRPIAARAPVYCKRVKRLTSFSKDNGPFGREHKAQDPVRRFSLQQDLPVAKFLHVTSKNPDISSE